jgi:GNAT superfamily N-acetyltransferase
LREPFTWSQTAAVFRERVRPDAEIWVGESKEGVVAFIALKGSSINRLYVDPASWRQGWGSRLIDKAKERSPGHLTVETDTKPRGAAYFYEAQGFSAVGFYTSDPPESEDYAVYEWRAP